MKNLYKKIGVVVLSGIVLAGGALVGNVSVSHADSISFENIKKIFKDSYDYQFHKIDFIGDSYIQNPYGPEIVDLQDIDELEREVNDCMIGFGIYKVGDIVFKVSDI